MNKTTLSHNIVKLLKPQIIEKISREEANASYKEAIMKLHLTLQYKWWKPENNGIAYYLKQSNCQTIILFLGQKWHKYSQAIVIWTVKSTVLQLKIPKCYHGKYSIQGFMGEWKVEQSLFPFFAP
jgi:hypothetical protein